MITSLVIVATPGTGALYTLCAAVSRRGVGRRDCRVCALGSSPPGRRHHGDAAPPRASGVAFGAIRILGVAYLLWMAWSTWHDDSRFAVHDGQPARSARRVIVKAVFVNLLNPMLTIFFFAFLPQFVPSHARHKLAGLLLLSGTFMP